MIVAQGTGRSLFPLDDTTLDLLPLPASLCDADGSVRACNRAADALWGPDAAFRLHHADGRLMAQSCTPTARALLTGQPQANHEALLERADGSRVPVLISASPLRNPVGQVVGAVTVFQDLSACKGREARLHQRLAQLEDARAQTYDFLALLAHELRNPLAPLRNGLLVLRLADADRATADRAQSLMERQVGAIARILDDLLDTCRLRQGKVCLRSEPVDLAGLARQGVADHRPAFERRDVALRLEGEHVPVWVEGDGGRLSQVLDHLLDYALQVTDREGTVTVRVTADAAARQAILSVRDTGVGLDAELLPYLFEVFTQVERYCHRSRGGIGLGLAVVKGLVELHGGEIEVASTGRGQGTAFTVRLPARPEPTALAGSAADPGQARRRLRILVVEDNRAAAEGLCRLLELFSHEVRSAHDGLTGVRVATEWRPDVVLCDIGLPGLDGYGVVRELRRQPRTAGVRAIALSGLGTEEDHLRSQDAGFDVHLTKPVDPCTLRDLLVAGPLDPVLPEGHDPLAEA